MKEVIIYTDGACSGNPGPGGWCAILSYKNYEKILSGNESNTTNNRMELIAVIESLKALKEPCNVTIYTDSQYVVNAFNNKWITNWIKNNWKLNDGNEVKNKELWQELVDLIKVHKVNFKWVKGHADNKKNNECDKIAREMINKVVK
ncbi:ribonuclease HI [Caldicellulosiruptoraceae bacterium PP1]